MWVGETSRRRMRERNTKVWNHNNWEFSKTSESHKIEDKESQRIPNRTNLKRPTNLHLGVSHSNCRKSKRKFWKSSERINYLPTWFCVALSYILDYMSLSARVQFIFSENCFTCRCILDVFIGGGLNGLWDHPWRVSSLNHMLDVPALGPNTRKISSLS